MPGWASWCRQERPMRSSAGFTVSWCRSLPSPTSARSSSCNTWTSSPTRRRKRAPSSRPTSSAGGRSSRRTTSRWIDGAVTPSTIAEPARSTPVFGAFDVVVLGGGPAGLAARTAAARRGAKTLVVERYGFFGGMGTAAGVTNFCGLHANVHGSIVQVVHGVADELLDRMRALDGLNEPHLVFGKILAQAYDTAAFKCAADAMLLSAGAEVLFHASAVGVVGAERGDVEALLVETKSGRLAIRGRTFVDCSGDGD